jgi:ketosteroid isomerase-like protein
MGDYSNDIVLLEAGIVHLKVCGSQTALQQFHDGFDLQDRPLRLGVIVM